MKKSSAKDHSLEVAEAVRAACIETALRAYEDARISGLCHEGAWEAAISAMRVLELGPLTGSERR